MRKTVREVVAKAAALLKSLREHLVLLDVVVGHRPDINIFSNFLRTLFTQMSITSWRTS